MTIKTKLTMNVVTVLLVISAVVAASVVGLGIVKRRLTDLTEKSTPFQTRSMELQRAIHAATADLVKVGAASAQGDLDKYRKDAEATLTQVKKAEESVETLSLGDKIGAHAELMSRAGNLFAAIADRLKTEEAARAANVQLREKSSGVAARLQGLDQRVRALQTTRSAAYGSSLKTTNTISARLQWLDQLRSKIKDAELWCFEIESVKDPSKIEDLESRAAELGTTILASRVLIKEWKFEQGNSIEERLAGLDEKIARAVELKKGMLAKPNGESAKNYGQILGEAQTALGGILILIKLENSSLQLTYDAEMSRQATIFGQVGKSTEVLSGSAGLTSVALATEGLATRLFTINNAQEVSTIEASLNDSFSRISKYAKSVDASLKELDAKEERKMLSGAVADIDSMRTLLFEENGIIAKVKSQIQMKEKAAKAMEDVRGIVLKHAERAKTTMSSARDAQEQSILEVNRVVRRSTWLVMATGLAAVGFGIVFGAWIYRSIGRPLARLIKTTGQIAAGDLSHELPKAAKDEIGKVETSMATMVASLKTIVEKIRAATGSLASSSEELSATARTLDGNSEKQSSEVEQVAAAMIQMSQTTEDVARSATETSEAAKAMTKIALDGKKTVQSSGNELRKFVEAVNESASQVEGLGKSSEEVQGIIGLIREIADQTNLLALNAAIEAARAGDQGRGFAVVADSVRELAEKSLTAANDIARTIQSMQSEIRTSVTSMKAQRSSVAKVSEQVVETSKAMDTIVDYVANVTNMVDRIAVAAMQQSSTSREVSQNMEHINDATRHLRLSSSEMKDTAGSLSEIAFALSETMRWFKAQ